MSMVFAINYGDSVYIAGDGRTIKGSNIENKAIWTNEIISEEIQKVKPLNSKSVLYTSGLYPYCEEARNEIRSQITDNSTLEDIIESIKKTSLKYNNQYGFDKKFPVMGSVLAYFNKEPIYIGFCGDNDYVPVLENKNYEFGVLTGNLNATKDAINYFLGLQSTKLEVWDRMYETYRFITQKYPSIGGFIRIYKINKDGITLCVKRRV